MSGSSGVVAELEPLALRRRLQAGERLVLLDVREPAERGFCAIPGVPAERDLHIPLREVPGRLEEIRSATVEVGCEVVVYCHHGVRSEMAANWLAAQGIAGLINLAGGIDAWSREADPSTPRYV